jgi:hypothetical protein
VSYHPGKEQHERAPCFPLYPLPECKACQRYRYGAPVDPIKTVVIDASTLARPTCPMYTPKGMT